MEPIALRRAATGDDFEFAYRAREAAFRAYVEMTQDWREDEQRALHRRRFETQDFRIVRRGGVDVGVVAMAVAANALKVYQLMILPAIKGKA